MSNSVPGDLLFMFGVLIYKTYLHVMWIYNAKIKQNSADNVSLTLLLFSLFYFVCESFVY